MGSVVDAICECGFAAQVWVGGGMLTFMESCSFPCLCASCGNVVAADIAAKPCECPDCGVPDPVPYDDPALVGTPGQEIVAEWHAEELVGRSLILTDGTYKCPRCGRMTLRFDDAGICFD